MLAALAVLAVATATPVPWKNCGTKDSILTVSELDATPWPPAPGKDMSITFKGSINSEIDSGNVDVVVTYLGIPLINKKATICEAPVQCPIAAGPVDLTHSVEIPSVLPGGKYDVSLTATAQGSANILCAKLSFSVSAHGVVYGYGFPEPEEPIAQLPVTPITHEMALDNDMIDSVNALRTTWTAGRSAFWEGRTKNLMVQMMGTKITPRPNDFPVVERISTIRANVPTSFDSRTKWPRCIGPILNQADCGSCWAFGAAEAASDRYCIQHGQNQTAFEQLAPLDLVVNDWLNGGCQGGELYTAWQYIQQTGLASESCMPYGTWEKPIAGPIPTCPPASQPCLSFVKTPAAEQSCASSNEQLQRKQVSSVYAVSSQVEAIQEEIMNNGPVEGAFTVYSDFPTYKSGVYKRTSNDALGGHAIKIIGWGVENSSPYWLVQNSWTTTWGDGGYFKILRGVDECGIESNIVAGKW